MVAATAACVLLAARPRRRFAGRRSRPRADRHRATRRPVPLRDRPGAPRHAPRGDRPQERRRRAAPAPGRSAGRFGRCLRRIGRRPFHGRTDDARTGCRACASAPKLRVCDRADDAFAPARSPCAATSASMRSRRTDASSISSSTSTGVTSPATPFASSTSRRAGCSRSRSSIRARRRTDARLARRPRGRCRRALGLHALRRSGRHPFVHALDTFGTAHASSRASPRPRAATSPASASTSAARRSSSRTAARRSSWPARARSQCETRARQPRLPASTKTAGHGGSRSWRQAASSPLSAHRRPDASLGGAERVLERARPPSAAAARVLARVRAEVEVELGDPLLDDAPHRFTEVRHEAHESERACAFVPDVAEVRLEERLASRPPTSSWLMEKFARSKRSPMPAYSQSTSQSRSPSRMKFAFRRSL